MKIQTKIKVGTYTWGGAANECANLGNLGACKQCCKSYFEQIGQPEPDGFCREACKSLQ